MSTSQLDYSNPMANNSIIVSGHCNNNTRFYFYCCSNTSSTSYAELIGIFGTNVMSSYGAYVFRSGGSYTGCFHVRSSYSSYSRCNYYRYFPSSLQGVYTCRMLDANGVSQDFSMGIYPYGFNSKLHVKYVY